MISQAIGNWVRRHMLRLGATLGHLGVTPNMATLTGLLLNIIVAVIIGAGDLRWGGIGLLIASSFDMVDGAIARATNRITPFGGFFDSTLDRYSEIVVYIGLLWYLLETGDVRAGAMLSIIAATGALMISYARARAEAMNASASVGIVARPERVIILSLALIFGRPIWALWALAILTHLTAVWRIIHVYRLTQADATAVTRRASR